MHNIFNGHATTTATTHRQPKQRLPKGNATPEMAMHNIKLRLTCRTAATPRQQTWTHAEAAISSSRTQNGAYIQCKDMKKRLYYNKIYRIIYSNFKKNKNFVK